MKKIRSLIWDGILIKKKKKRIRGLVIFYYVFLLPMWPYLLVGCHGDEEDEDGCMYRHDDDFCM